MVPKVGSDHSIPTSVPPVAERAFKPERVRRTIEAVRPPNDRRPRRNPWGATLPGRANTQTDASSEPQLVIRHSDGDYAIGTFAHYLLTVWKTEVSLRNTIHWAQVFNDLRSALPGARLGSLSYLETTCRLPVPPEAGQTFVDALRRHGEALKGAAVVYNREGFWGAGVRSQMTSIVGESKAEIPYLMTLTVEPAITWLLEALADSAEGRAAALLRSLETLRVAPPTPPAPNR